MPWLNFFVVGIAAPVVAFYKIWVIMLNVCMRSCIFAESVCAREPNTENDVEMALTRLVHVKLPHCHCHCHCCCDGYEVEQN